MLMQMRQLHVSLALIFIYLVVSVKTFVDRFTILCLAEDVVLDVTWVAFSLHTMSCFVSAQGFVL